MFSVGKQKGCDLQNHTALGLHPYYGRLLFSNIHFLFFLKIINSEFSWTHGHPEQTVFQSPLHLGKTLRLSSGQWLQVEVVL